MRSGSTHSFIFLRPDLLHASVFVVEYHPEYFLGESIYKHRSKLSYKAGSAGIPSPFVLTSHAISPS